MKAWQTAGQPRYSVDTKKKELVGDYRTAAMSCAKGQPPKRLGPRFPPCPSWARSSAYGVLRHRRECPIRVDLRRRSRPPPSPSRASGMVARPRPARYPTATRLLMRHRAAAAATACQGAGCGRRAGAGFAGGDRAVGHGGPACRRTPANDTDRWSVGCSPSSPQELSAARPSLTPPGDRPLIARPPPARPHRPVPPRPPAPTRKASGCPMPRWPPRS